MTIWISNDRYPFDWKTPIGYTLAATLQYTAVSVILFATSSTVVIQMGVISMLISMTKDIKHDLHAINKKSKIKDHQPDILHHFTELIQYHSDAKLLSEYDKLFIFNFFHYSIVTFQIGQRIFKNIPCILHDNVFVEHLFNMHFNANDTNRISWVFLFLFLFNVNFYALHKINA